MWQLCLYLISATKETKGDQFSLRKEYQNLHKNLSMQYFKTILLIPSICRLSKPFWLNIFWLNKQHLPRSLPAFKPTQDYWVFRPKFAYFMSILNDTPRTRHWSVQCSRSGLLFLPTATSCYPKTATSLWGWRAATSTFFSGPPQGNTSWSTWMFVQRYRTWFCPMHVYAGWNQVCWHI